MKITVRYFRPVGDISISKRGFHRILNAECYARRFWRWINLYWTKYATIYSILTKTVRYIRPVGDISTFKRYFHCILHTEWYSRQFHRRNIKICAQNATIYTILKKTVSYIQPVGDISTFKRYFHRILHAEYYTRRFQRRHKPNCAQSATIYSILTKTVRYIDSVGYISTF